MAGALVLTEPAADEVQRAGGEALTVTVDMADAKAVENAAQQVADPFGHIGVWVNNAFGVLGRRFDGGHPAADPHVPSSGRGPVGRAGLA
ncbi:SDR family NAD(P)-dependent oxidoreductase [Streptomyces sp. NPDC127178]|uniref:SDR family NAD(P)-dependent oxidoreductase n=1 Tax=unclassified Streptomyces TaxID=2593676 RepID=UPI00362D187F